MPFIRLHGISRIKLAIIESISKIPKPNPNPNCHPTLRSTRTLTSPSSVCVTTAAEYEPPWLRPPPGQTLNKKKEGDEGVEKDPKRIHQSRQGRVARICHAPPTKVILHHLLRPLIFQTIDLRTTGLKITTSTVMEGT